MFIIVHDKYLPPLLQSLWQIQRILPPIIRIYFQYYTIATPKNIIYFNGTRLN